jgi:hypothetical protein
MIDESNPGPPIENQKNYCLSQYDISRSARWSGVRIRQGQKMFSLFKKPSIPGPGLAQVRIQGVPRYFDHSKAAGA